MTTTHPRRHVPALSSLLGLTLALTLAPLGAAPAQAATTCLGKTVTITGTSGADTLTGTSGDDVIDAGAGDDTVTGGGGNDTVCGGDGADTLDGGTGNDTVDGGAGTDTWSFASATTAVTASLATGTSSGAGTDKGTTLENLRGGTGADTLTGSTGTNTIEGGAGNDRLDGGSGTDTVSYRGATTAVTVNLTTRAATGGAGTDTLAGFENVRGGAGGDTITGSTGANTVDGGPGTDRLTGGGGTDTVSFDSATAGVTASLATGTATGGSTDTFSGFAQLVGSPSGDTLVGNDGANRLDGARGGDACSTGKGADTLVACEDLTVVTDAAGATDAATWSLSAGQRFFLDNLLTGTAGTNLTWGVTGPGGTTVLAPVAVTTANKGPWTATAGTHTATLGGTAAGTHRFRLVLPATTTYPYTLGTTVGANTPSSGQGVLGVQDVDRYTFTATAGQRVFFLSSGDTMAGYAYVRLTQPSGAVVMEKFLVGDRGPITLPVAGTYTLSVGTPTGDDHAGTYGFRLATVPAAQTFATSIGSAVAPGVPGTGAGTLEQPGSEDRYTFSGTAGQKVFYDAGTDTTGNHAFVTVTSPSGAKVLEKWVTGDSAVLTLPTTGTYTVSVKAGVDDRATGTYGFTIQPATAGPQTFPITLGATVKDGVPGPGAGNLEGPGAVDTYTFTATAGDRIGYTSLADTTANYGYVTLYAPSGATVWSGWIAANRFPAAVPATGTYRLEVRTTDTTHWGTYSFALVKAAAQQTFAYTLGSTVSNGVPAAGAGNVEGVGGSDTYTFSGTAGDRLLYDVLAESTNGYLSRTLIAPDGRTVEQGWAYGDRGGIVLPATGTYRLVIAGTDNTHWGTYSFRLMKTPAPQTFAIRVGQTVSNGVPAAGAGNLETVGSVDVYTFSATSGQDLRFDHLADATSGYGIATVTDPSGRVVLTKWLGYDTDLPTLTSSGTYTVTIRTGDNDAVHSGTYSFALVTR
ncbi:beta strand repeat-containing protein [Cellulomonas marina]|uniref:Hemolysin-type calcium-binding repeat-containing protein n=1 Tax=Cellulomonas marina TaxID=988821 RepID=A0A1I0Y1G7_9CELL|nr:calcium-binding protein [Cellulomonas marina]GIG28396.1 hypothetical protein Cma02nite_09960 [Cellulomonas marina]SFB07199.1 Hemolysin-type calcium-binding repeat-containing protein [Cellulomonas marina]